MGRKVYLVFQFGGWSLYTKDGKLNYCYNWVGLEQYKLTADKPLPAGKVNVKFVFAYDGGGLGKDSARG